jgi:hypothetical protein
MCEVKWNKRSLNAETYKEAHEELHSVEVKIYKAKYTE